MKKKIVIVGSGHAGGRVAQILAASDHDLDITLIGRESVPPYNRPPLSKGILLGKSRFEDCLIWRPGDRAWDKVKFLSGTAAKSIQTESRTLLLDDATKISYDSLVLATGSRVRHLTVPGSKAEGVHVLRTIEDAVKISGYFKTIKRLVVVGGGFIGLEIAAAASSIGLKTVVVEATERLLSRIAPRKIGDALLSRHQRQGVEFRFSSMVEQFLLSSSGKLKGVRLSSGEYIRTNLTVMGVGVSAEGMLARSAGLEVDVGIRTGQSLETAVKGIFACGDCASFWHPLFERHIRVEAWQNAEDHARVVASNILGEEASCSAVPFFWSDQYELSMQIVGLPHLASSAVAKHLGSSTLLYHLNALGRLVGATGLGDPNHIGKHIRAARYAIAARAHPTFSALQDGVAREVSL